MQRPQQNWGSGQSGRAALGEMLISPVSQGDSVREAAAFSPTHWRKEILDSMNQEFPAWKFHGSPWKQLLSMCQGFAHSGDGRRAWVDPGYSENTDSWLITKVQGH